MNYCDAGSETYAVSDKVVARQAVDGLQSLYPTFEPGDVEATYVFRARCSRRAHPEPWRTRMTPTLPSDADHTGRDLGDEEPASTTAAFSVIAGGTLAAGYQIDAGEDFVTLLAPGTFAVVSFPILLATTGFVAPDEWESLRRGVSRLPPSASVKLS